MALWRRGQMVWGADPSICDNRGQVPQQQWTFYWCHLVRFPTQMVTATLNADAAAAATTYSAFRALRYYL